MKNSSFEFVIDTQENCFFMKHYGVFSLNMIAEGTKALERHKDFKWDFNRLIDVTNCVADLSSSDLRILVDRITARQEGGASYKGIFLIDSPLAHGLARIFGSLMDNSFNMYQILNVEDKKTTLDAREWLDLPPGFTFPGFLSLK